MYEKILQKLKAQRGTTSNVTDRSLEDLAKSLVSVVTTDEILAVADLTSAITSIDGNINHYTAEQIKALESKANVKTPEQIAVETEAKKKADEEAAKAKGLSPEVAALMESQKQMMETLNRIQGEKITNTRSEQLSTILKDAPKEFKDQTLTNLGYMNFPDDASFDAFKESTKTASEAFVRKAKEDGISYGTPGVDVQRNIEDPSKSDIEMYKDINKTQDTSKQQF